MPFQNKLLWQETNILTNIHFTRICWRLEELCKISFISFCKFEEELWVFDKRMIPLYGLGLVWVKVTCFQIKCFTSVICHCSNDTVAERMVKIRIVQQKKYPFFLNYTCTHIYKQSMVSDYKFFIPVTKNKIVEIKILWRI